MKNKYVKQAYAEVSNRNKGETQFLNAVKEVFESLEPVYDAHPELAKKKYLERIAEPQRVIEFKVEWKDDNGDIQVNRGYRVQQNNAIGPFKGGLRFNQSVNLSILKSLAFEQTFKNALTGCPMGGGKGGSDFDPHGKSPAEIERFCHAFMKQLYPYIGSKKDVPAGDLGVGGTEIGYLIDEYLKHRKDIGTLTGKPLDKGGLKGRTEATGYGLCYFTEEMLNDHGKSFKGAKVLISGSGNVSTYACAKATELGATVIGMSDRNGYIVDEAGIDYKKLIKAKEGRASIENYLKYSDTAKYAENPTDLFKVKADIVLPCATQNEIDLDTAKTLVTNGVYAVAEGANLPTKLDAIAYLQENKVLFGPAKASNAGGVGCSYFEMCQNAEDSKWTFNKTDKKLHEMMVGIYHNVKDAAERYGDKENLVMGANIFGFETVTKKMK
ncbi:MAG: NADP-specific glutamate dehydrogenase [Erysipelotrichaceae bacterium]|nr:NADP-specific glutamate dehydrogenase [Erysipelotrichaceae bacterium]